MFRGRSQTFPLSPLLLKNSPPFGIRIYILLHQNPSWSYYVYGSSNKFGILSKFYSFNTCLICESPTIWNSISNYVLPLHDIKCVHHTYTSSIQNSAAEYFQPNLFIKHIMKWKSTRVNKDSVQSFSTVSLLQLQPRSNYKPTLQLDPDSEIHYLYYFKMSLHTWNSNILLAPHTQFGISFSSGLFSPDTQSGPSPPLQYLIIWNTAEV